MTPFLPLAGRKGTRIPGWLTRRLTELLCRTKPSCQQSGSTHLTFVSWWLNSQSPLWVHLTGSSLNHLQSSSEIGWEIQLLCFLCVLSCYSFCALLFFIVCFLEEGWVGVLQASPWYRLGVGEVTWLPKKFLWRRKWGVRSSRMALGFIKTGEEWETKGEEKSHLLNYTQAPRSILWQYQSTNNTHQYKIIL